MLFTCNKVEKNGAYPSFAWQQPTVKFQKRNKGGREIVSSFFLAPAGGSKNEGPYPYHVVYQR